MEDDLIGEMDVMWFWHGRFDRFAGQYFGFPVVRFLGKFAGNFTIARTLTLTGSVSVVLWSILAHQPMGILVFWSIFAVTYAGLLSSHVSVLERLSGEIAIDYEMLEVPENLRVEVRHVAHT